MIPAIGYMIGFYIITRMLVLLGRKEKRVESMISRVFAVVTMIVTVLMMYILFTAESSMPSF